jgi:hypothetical protein
MRVLIPANTVTSIVFPLPAIHVALAGDVGTGSAAPSGGANDEGHPAVPLAVRRTHCEGHHQDGLKGFPVLV